MTKQNTQIIKDSFFHEMFQSQNISLQHIHACPRTSAQKVQSTTENSHYSLRIYEDTCIQHKFKAATSPGKSIFTRSKVLVETLYTRKEVTSTLQSILGASQHQQDSSPMQEQQHTFLNHV